MQDWKTKLDDFLRFNERDVLPGAGSVRREAADAHAKGEYEAFATQRRALKEAEGEDAFRKLEQSLPKRPAAPRKRGGKP